MQLGVIVPQGWIGEYDGWDPAKAWSRTVHVGEQADALGFESIWVYDHFHTVPKPTQEITFESFSTLAALGSITERVRLGHVVICAGFRNPALTAKMMSTMDVQTGGRMELGIGAGWKRDEWEAYGYGFPSARERLANLGDQLEIIAKMMAPGLATYEGDHGMVRDAINVPKPLQRPGIPIMVGGNGPEVTWRLAARHADELNLDGLTPEELVEALPIIASRCEEIDRDPDDLRVSVHVFATRFTDAGPSRVDLLGRYAELGVSRVIGLVSTCVDTDTALEELAADAAEAGIEMAV
ncbi:MAG: LLM class flavin-dependent oxidoreductase [Acidimicrobiia bacterium]|nr:LLM class flavin-dependent oxidoreductase [Acidimicrobiia bacterium]